MPPRAAPRRGLTRRGLLKGGLGLTGAAGLLLPGTGAYAAMEAADELAITDYRPMPRNWPDGHRLTITVDRRPACRRPQYGPRARARRWSMPPMRSAPIWWCCSAISSPRIASSPSMCRTAPGPRNSPASAPLGVYAILGNHDWWYDIEGVRRALDAACDIPLMENDAVLLGEPGRRFWLAGLGDQLAYWLGPSRFRGVDDLPGTLAQGRAPTIRSS